MRRYAGITRALLYDSTGAFVAFDKLSTDTVINDMPQEPETTNGTIHGQNAIDWQLHFFDFTSAKVAQLNAWMLAGTEVRAMMIGVSHAYNFFKVTEPLSVYTEPANARDGARKGFVAGTFIGANYNDLYVTQQIAELFGRNWDVMKSASYVFLGSAERVAQTVFPSDRRPTVERNSPVNVVNQFGLLAEVEANKAAIEFNADGTYKGLLPQSQATNLLMRSNNFAHSNFTKQGTTASQTTDLYVGVCTLITEGTGNEEHSIQRLADVMADGVANRSIELMVKNVSGARYFYLSTAPSGSIAGAAGGRISATFDLQTMTLTYSGGNLASSQIQDMGNGWMRVSIFASVVSAGSAGRRWRFGFLNANDTTESYTGTGKQVLIAFGGAYEGKGVTLQSPILTEGSTVIRLADSVTLTGASSLIGQTQGYVGIGFTTKNTETARVLVDLWEDASNYIRIGLDASNQLIGLVVAGGVTQASFTSSALADNTKFGAVLSYSAGATSLSLSGAQVGTTDASATIPALSKENLGMSLASDQRANCHIATLAQGLTALSLADANTLSTRLAS